MNKLAKNQKGSTLILVLIVMSVLMILGIAITTISFSETRFTSSHEDRKQAYYIARTGAHAVSDYIINDNKGDADELIEAALNNQAEKVFGGGNFKVYLEEVENSDDLLVVSIGEYNDVRQTVRTKIVQSGIFWGNFAIAGNIIDTSGNGNGTTITGNVAAKETLDLNRVDVDGDADIEEELVFPEVVPPDEYDKEYGNITNDLPIDLDNYSDKYIYAEDIFVRVNHKDIVIEGEGNVHLYVDGNIDMHNNCRFIVPEDAKLFIYVIGSRTITLHQGSSNTNNNVLVYAPESTIEFESAGPSYIFNGAIVGDTVTLHNRLTITHNRDMASFAEIDNPAKKSYTWLD